MTDDELERLTEDLAAVTEPGPAIGEHGARLHGLVDSDEDEDQLYDGYLRRADEDQSGVGESVLGDPDTT